MSTHSLNLKTDLLCFRLMGITEQTLLDFEAGLVEAGNGCHHCCLAVRVHDHDGTERGFMTQSLDQWARAHRGSWRLPAGPGRSSVLYNWHRIDPRDQQTLFVTTGPFMVMKLVQAGYRQAIALINGAIAVTTFTLLKQSSARNIRFLFGCDNGWRATAQVLTKHLGSKTQSVFLPEDLFPDQLSQAELKELLEPYLNTTKSWI